MRVALGRPTGGVGELREVRSSLAVEGLHTVICWQRVKHVSSCEKDGMANRVTQCF